MSPPTSPWCRAGLQDVLPEFLRSRFVEAALSYVACNSEGELLCRNNDCWCHCSPKFPECNCPFADIKAMEENLRKSKDTWVNFNNDFMGSGKTQLPTLAVLPPMCVFCFCIEIKVVCRHAHIDTRRDQYGASLLGFHQYSSVVLLRLFCTYCLTLLDIALFL